MKQNLMICCVSQMRGQNMTQTFLGVTATVDGTVPFKAKGVMLYMLVINSDAAPCHTVYTTTPRMFMGDIEFPPGPYTYIVGY